jgi:four helix bundle protein
MARTQCEELRVYRLAEQVCDAMWVLVRPWSPLARSTIGRQIIRSADAIEANIAEGAGRRSFVDNRRFVRMVRGSLNETKHWLRRAFQRGLLNETDVVTLKPIMGELAPTLNACLRSISKLSDESLKPAPRPRSGKDEAAVGTNHEPRTTNHEQATTHRR